MKKRNTLSLGQQAIFYAAVLKALPRDIDPELARNWEKNGETLAKVLREALLPPDGVKKKDQICYLDLLKTTTLAPTSGSDTIANANTVFTHQIDLYFKIWGTDVIDTDLPETKVSVYKVVNNGNYRTLFGSLGDPYSLTLTQGQIVEFCRTRRHLLGDMISFLIEVKKKLYVAEVYECDKQLGVHIKRFDDFYVFKAGNWPRLRLVTPRLVT